ncbi:MULTISPECIES: M6 family metalloprotease domain-containing protein [unclassified Streptomyces]|uniref:M6 family metalloprotease domain-containing protein n=1 Tax=unclassified Streptomyces TaxID=2593676 RepID=UPI001BE8B7B3|nr:MULTISPECIES: M6 family metalloprotease domain-containing protein [unclassified Streptomyces]MBT2406532.1 M6 family metalloprotease domain-containing protein [Streptomyces sp. ISL-21]MBT2608870.1 M6 family metalloprotease domain-containing protein [Streptomyces sp. ISL-87]
MSIPPRRRPRATAAMAVLLTCLAAAPTTATAAEGPPLAAPAAACALPGRTGWTDEGHDTDRTLFQPSTGTRRVLTLFVDFPDAPAGDPTDAYAAHLAPAAEWMRAASYGRSRLAVSSLRRWIRMPADSESYGFTRGLTFEAHEKYVRDAVTAADPYADFSRYDMVYIVPTKAATAISFSPTYLYDPATPGVTADGARLKWAVTFGQDMWHWGPKVAAHETGHTFGLPDLYSFTGAAHQYVGGWDVMGNIAGPAPQYLGWHSWKLGWTRDDQVACLPGAGRRTVLLTPVERPGGTKIAVLRTSETTAYVVESRRAEGNDRAACSSGVLIYKVDSAAPTGEGPVRFTNGNPAATSPAGCTQLDLAAYTPGRTFSDTDTGVRIDVLADGGAGDVVRLRKS